MCRPPDRPTYRRGVRPVLGVALVGLALTALPAASAAQGRCVTHPDSVVVDGRAVWIAGAKDLPDLLSRYVSFQRFFRESGPQDAQPMVVVDGLHLMSGAERLASVSLVQVESVTVLTPMHAATRFGTRSGRGAILITTKRGDQGARCARPSAGIVAARGTAVECAAGIGQAWSSRRPRRSASGSLLSESIS
jgi:hypothetical protein